MQPVSEIYTVGLFGNCGIQAAADTSIKDDPVLQLLINCQDGKNIVIGMDEPRLRDLGTKLIDLADILKKRTKPDADRTPTAKQVVRDNESLYTGSATV